MPNCDLHKRPLEGLRILVTRPESQARDFIDMLEKAGASPILLPTIKIVDPPSWEKADSAITRLVEYQWLIFGSTNGVNCFYQRLKIKKLDHRDCTHLTTICVGPKTAEAASKIGLQCNLIPKEYAAEGIIKLFAGLDISQQKVLLPRALKARELLPETLRQKGAYVDVVPVYETIFPPESTKRLNHLVSQEEIDIITVTSASSAVNLLKNCHNLETLKILTKLPTACIGPITAEAATKAGLNVEAVANDYTSAGLLKALKIYQLDKTIAN